MRRVLKGVLAGVLAITPLIAGEALAANGLDNSRVFALMPDPREPQAPPPPAPPRLNSANDAVEVSNEIADLPQPVRDMRQRIINAARTGEIARLGPIVARQNEPLHVGFDVVDDPIDFMRRSSNDGEGREPLAILIELLEAPYAVVPDADHGKVYVWPYLAAMPDLSHLDAEQMIDLYKLVSHTDFQDMLQMGSWYFYRTMISADGQWLAFIAGD